MDQTELTPALERVAASVVETHRKRQQVEEELKAAAAAVASLHSQSSSLEASVLALRAELERALQLKAQEDAVLATLAAKQQAAADQLAAIAKDVETFLADKQRTAAAIETQAQSAHALVHSVEGEVAGVKTSLASFSGDAAALRARLAEVVQTANAVDGRIGEIQSKAHELDTAVDGIAAKVCGIADDLDRSDRERQQIVTSTDELRSLSTGLETRRAEAAAASKETAKLLEERQKQTGVLNQQIEGLAQLSVEATPPAPAAQPEDPNRAYVEHRDAKMRAEEPARPRFSQTIELIQLLGALGFVAHDEKAVALELLSEGDVDKFVRSLWSRAMGGPQPGPYRIIIGTALGESGDHKGAMTFLNKALEGRNVDAMLTYLVAIALLQMKRYVDVLRIAQVLSRTKNGKTLSRNIEALHLAGSGRPDEAEKKLAEALTIPAQPRAHYSETLYNLAQLAQRRGDAGTAAMWFERLTVADPSYRDAAVHMESLRADATRA